MPDATPRSTAERRQAGAGAPPGPRTPMSALGAKLDAVEGSAADAEAAVDRFMQGVDLSSDPEPRDYAMPGEMPRTRLGWRNRYTRWVVAWDLLVTLGAGLLLCRLAGASPVPVLATLGPVMPAAWVLARAYEHRFMGQGTQEYRRLVTAGVWTLAAAAVLALVTGSHVLRAAALAVPVSTAAGCLVHLLARRVLHELRHNGLCLQHSVAIGLERSVAELIRTTRRDRVGGFDIVAACVSRTSADRIEDVPVWGTPLDALRVIRRSGADTVILTAWSDVSQDELRRLSWDLEGSGIQLLVAPRLTAVAVPRVHVRTVGGMPLLHVDEPEFRGVRRVAKAGLDYGLTLAAMAVLAVPMLVVALLVRFTSPGPVLFRQERIGKHGRPFTMHKFRSMYVDAEARRVELDHLNEHEGGPMFKLKDDPRVTPVGRLLRRFSLDELPQLFDVLARRMSLVGPRPPLSQEVAQYEDDARRRLLVKPGITGLWQVSGRSDLSWEDTVRLDLHYVENWSLGLDLSIIARTVAAVVARDGAY